MSPHHRKVISDLLFLLNFGGAPLEHTPGPGISEPCAPEPRHEFRSDGVRNTMQRAHLLDPPEPCVHLFKTLSLIVPSCLRRSATLVAMGTSVTITSTVPSGVLVASFCALNQARLLFWQKTSTPAWRGRGDLCRAVSSRYRNESAFNECFSRRR